MSSQIIALDMTSIVDCGDCSGIFIPAAGQFFQPDPAATLKSSFHNEVAGDNTVGNTSAKVHAHDAKIFIVHAPRKEDRSTLANSIVDSWKSSLNTESIVTCIGDYQYIIAESKNLVDIGRYPICIIIDGPEYTDSDVPPSLLKLFRDAHKFDLCIIYTTSDVESIPLKFFERADKVCFVDSNRTSISRCAYYMHYFKHQYVDIDDPAVQRMNNQLLLFDWKKDKNSYLILSRNGSDLVPKLLCGTFPFSKTAP